MRDQQRTATGPADTPRLTFRCLVLMLLVGGLLPSTVRAQFDWRATSVPGFARRRKPVTPDSIEFAAL